MTAPGSGGCGQPLPGARDIRNDYASAGMMQAACALLLAVAAIATVNDWYYHARTCHLRDRPECQKEVQRHNLRSFAIALELLVIANLHLRGAAVGLLAAIIGISWYGKIRDVIEETPSR